MWPPSKQYNIKKVYWLLCKEKRNKARRRRGGGDEDRPEVLKAALENLQKENEPEVGLVKLPDKRHGPNHVAKLMMAKEGKKELIEEEKDLFALRVYRLEQSFEKHTDKASYLVDVARCLLDSIIDNGGAGKTNQRLSCAHSGITLWQSLHSCEDMSQQ